MLQIAIGKLFGLEPLSGPRIILREETRDRAYFWGLTCENRFVRLELPSADGERDVAKFLVLKQQPEIVGQPALRYFKLYRITLPGDVDAVGHDADLRR